MKDLLIISKKWGTGRGRYTSIERFCEILDPAFPDYHGERIHVHPFISRKLKNLTNSRRSDSNSAPYTSYSFELELWGLIKAFQKKSQYIFFPYADYDYYYWQYLKIILKTKVILWTFFSELELSNRFRDLEHFKKADAVLVAGKSQLNYINLHAPEVKAQFFPIGVDTNFFTPCGQFDSNRLVHIGANRRDFKTLIQALDIVFVRNPKLQVDMVGVSTLADKIPKRPYLNIHGFLSDQEYLGILQSCNFALLSLEDGGSSNSLLEISSCGLPVVITEMPNIKDYLLTPFSITVPKNNSVQFAADCIRLMENEHERGFLAREARKNALLFDWINIKDHFLQILKNI